MKKLLVIVLTGLLMFLGLFSSDAVAKGSKTKSDKKSAITINKTKSDKRGQPNKKIQLEDLTFTTQVLGEEEETEAPQLFARVKNGAQFVINPETGEVVLTTPSGNIHTLNLPESAVANMMQKAEAVEENEDVAGEEETTQEETEEASDSEEVATEVTEQKYLLGLFPVDAVTEVTINTQTGEVVEGTPSNLIDWILDKLSV